MASATNLPKIERGWLHAYFVCDVADSIDLTRLQGTGDEFKSAQLELRAVASPQYIRFTVPPLSAKLRSAEVCGHQTISELKVYDYGTVVVRLSFSLSGSWEDFARQANRIRQSEELPTAAGTLLGEVKAQIKPGLNKPHAPLLEDYFVIAVEAFDPSLRSADLLRDFRGPLAKLILDESRQLSAAEEDETLKVHYSYFENDLAVLHWEAAFVFDTKEGAEAMENILEFANTQLVELRTYDTRLNGELDEIYKSAGNKEHGFRFFGLRKAERRAEQLRYLLVDIRELADRSSNALKITGDAFYARLYRGAALRLGLSDWQQQVDSKLESISEIYRFATDQAQHAWTEFLEIVVIILIAVEVVLGVLGLRH
jgi:hypothetical protein